MNERKGGKAPPDPCDDCDVRRRCEKSIHGRFCATFKGAGHVEYFKRDKQ